MEGVETGSFRIPPVGRSQTKPFFFVMLRRGLFQSIERFYLSKEGVRDAQNMMYNVGNMTKH